MAMARRPMFLPALAIMLAGWASFWLCAAAGWGKAAAFTMPSTATSTSSDLRLRRGTATHELRGSSKNAHADAARSGDVSMRAAAASEDPALSSETVDVGGFSGFVMGLTLLPHVLNCLLIAFTVFVGPAGFTAGPYGLSVISCAVTFGLAGWSISSFVSRGCGLPAGPLGLLGLSEGLAYIAILGLAIASLVSGVRGPISSSSSDMGDPLEAKAGIEVADAKKESTPAPALPKIKAADIQLPELKIPSNIKTPELRIPEFKPPEFKQPQMKMPDFNKPPRPDGAPDASDKPADPSAPSAEDKLSASAAKKEQIQKAKRLAKVKAFAAQQEELTED